jgi:hypothetical protein
MYGHAVCSVSEDGEEAVVPELLSTGSAFYKGAFEVVAWDEAA